MQNSHEAGNRRILIIDDNPAIHEDYRKILAAKAVDTELDDLTAMVLGEASPENLSLQFELISATQGQEGYELVRQAIEAKRPFAMAFVDMRMPPGWDGLETIEHLWQVDPHLQIVICTAYSDYSWSEIIQRVKHRDRLLILKKPFDNTEVCQLAIALTHKWELERQSKERMKAIVETAADGIITFRENGAIELCNGASCELFGRPQEELVGANIRELLSAESGTDWSAYLSSGAAHGQAIVKVAQELQAQRKDGQLVSVLFSLSEFSTEHGRVFTAILRDLTEYKRLHRELAESQKLESIGQLAAGVSHEISAPMQYISDNVEYLNECLENLFTVVDEYEVNLQQGPARPWHERTQHLADIKEQTGFTTIRKDMLKAIEESMDGVRRVIQIVRAMKQFSHVGGEQKVATDLNEAIRSTVTITRNRWKHVAEIDLQLDPDLPPLECRPGEINQALLNLVINASEAVAKKLGDDPSQLGKITIRTRVAGGEIVIEFKDTGAGISDEAANRIFDPFFTTKEAGNGSGQGLALCHDVIVHNHQGRIDVISPAGGGATFTVRLPLLSAKPSEAEADEPQPAGEQPQIAAENSESVETLEVAR